VGIQSAWRRVAGGPATAGSGRVRLLGAVSSRPGAESPYSRAGQQVWPCRFGGGDGEGVVAEAGDEVEFVAECLHVAGDGHRLC